MPELRQDPTTKEWVVIATERAKRPDQFAGRGTITATHSPDELCVLCPGNEALTPSEVFALRESGERDTSGWRVRVVPNKFPAFRPSGNVARKHNGLIFNSAEAHGYHEVIIETPGHLLTLALLDEQQILDVLRVYKQRYDALRSDPRVKLVLIFRNHGASAGTSLAHPHSQVAATPIIPLHIRQKYDVAIRHYDDTGHCLYCDVVSAEISAGKRVVLETGRFAVIHPFASQVPFESWILPKRHNSCFGHINAEEMAELASVLRRVLLGLYDGLGNPDFNLILHTAPTEDEEKPYFLWHIEIRPRLTTAAGFELGTGIYINTAVPEETAPFFGSLLEAATEGRRS